MFVDRLYVPVTTLGPGERVVVWTCGCAKHCRGCANPELWETRPDAAIEPARLAALLANLAERTGTRRITFTGGDPLEQADELAQVLAAIRSSFDDILVYTGFTLEELQGRADFFSSLLTSITAASMLGDEPQGSSDSSGKSPSTEANAPVPGGQSPDQTPPPLIDVLIDGPYLEALNDGTCALRGSTNQRVIVLNPALENLYHEEMSKPRRVQNAVFDGRAMSIGIHGRPHGKE